MQKGKKEERVRGSASEQGNYYYFIFIPETGFLFTRSNNDDLAQLEKEVKHGKNKQITSNTNFIRPF